MNDHRCCKGATQAISGLTRGRAKGQQPCPRSALGLSLIWLAVGPPVWKTRVDGGRTVTSTTAWLPHGMDAAPAGSAGSAGSAAAGVAARCDVAFCVARDLVTDAVLRDVSCELRPKEHLRGARVVSLFDV